MPKTFYFIVIAENATFFQDVEVKAESLEEAGRLYTAFSLAMKNKYNVTLNLHEVIDEDVYPNEGRVSDYPWQTVLQEQ
jgi:hypothetical protein